MVGNCGKHEMGSKIQGWKLPGHSKPSHKRCNSIFPPCLIYCCHFQSEWATDNCYWILGSTTSHGNLSWPWHRVFSLLNHMIIFNWFTRENRQRQSFRRPTTTGGSHQRQLAGAPQVPVHLALTGAIGWQGPQPPVHCPSLHAMAEPVGWLVSRGCSGPRQSNSPRSPGILGHNFSGLLQQLWYTDLGSLRWSCWDALNTNAGGTRNRNEIMK